jgi:hypothetical protein
MTIWRWRRAVLKVMTPIWVVVLIVGVVAWVARDHTPNPYDDCLAAAESRAAHEERMGDAALARGLEYVPALGPLLQGDHEAAARAGKDAQHAATQAQLEVDTAACQQYPH